MSDDTTTLRVAGVDELVRTLRRAGRDLEDLGDAHRKAADIVADAAAARAPRRTGRLAGSIRATRQPRRARIEAGRPAIPYAGPIHWGWPAHHITAQPFLVEGADDTEARWLDEYETAVQAACDEVRGV